MKQKEKKGFDQKYWNENYSEPMTMDGIGNAHHHAQYLKNLFDLDGIEIQSIIDFGFGHGDLLVEMAKVFNPQEVMGIEASEYIFELRKKYLANHLKKNSANLLNLDLKEWCLDNQKNRKVYDLGICTSVFQYIDSKDFKLILPILSKKVRFFYLTFPTNKELLKQRKELEFFDQYALSRTRSFYWKTISPYFTVVSNRLLESKYHFNEKTTAFTEFFYRF